MGGARPIKIPYTRDQVTLAGLFDSSMTLLIKNAAYFRKYAYFVLHHNASILDA
jgi:hypothetical protein